MRLIVLNAEAIDGVWADDDSAPGTGARSAGAVAATMRRICLTLHHVALGCALRANR